jgi:hypothetical protein
MQGHLTMKEFARATRRPLDEVRRAVLDGDLPFEQGRCTHRGSDGLPCYAHMIPETEIERFAAPAVKRALTDPREIADPTERRNAVMAEAYARRNREIALEAGDPEAIAADAGERAAQHAEASREALRQMKRATLGK